MENFSLNTPKNLDTYAGKFVVFFSEDENPVVLFNSFISEEAYAFAAVVEKKQGRNPVVMRIEENPQNNIAQLLAFR